ncbi:MAG: hypothetical protein JJT95_16560 [Pararhodobacter sp.]|nr:hypothetical protein [Pararhodobacter sp.]
MSCQSRESALAIVDSLTRARRPRLLLQAARAGLGEYRRECDLRRILRLPVTPPPGHETLRALVALEAGQEDLRQHRLHAAGEPWRPARHVEVMIALMAEARLMVRPVPPAATLMPPPSALPATAAG